MSTPQQPSKLSPEDIQLVQEVYRQRAKYLGWLVKSALLGIVAGTAVGWASAGIFSGVLLNPLTWLSMLWIGALPSALSNRQGTFVASVLTAPLLFKKELGRRSEEVREGQAKLVARLGPK